ncbi:MAG TPA: PilZ domain-containing protein [Nitrospirota bacterium]
MADNQLEKHAAAGSRDEIAERRREKRYDVAAALQHFIKLKVKTGNGYVNALLGNISRNGLLFECPVPFNKGDAAECVVSITTKHHREISFRVQIMYCYADHGSHIMGATIDEISHEQWFDAFVDAHDLIVQRQGK